MCNLTVWLRTVALTMIATLIFLNPVVVRATPITSGHPLEVSFLNLAFLQPSGAQNQGGFSLNFSSTDLFDLDETVRFELFEDANFSIPISVTGETDPTDYYMQWTNTSPDTDQIGISVIGIWQDLEGSFRVSILAGSVDVRSARVWGFVNGQQYEKYVVGSADNQSNVGVPEPSTLALIGVALLSIFGFSMMRHRQAQ